MLETARLQRFFRCDVLMGCPNQCSCTCIVVVRGRNCGAADWTEMCSEHNGATDMVVVSIVMGGCVVGVATKNNSHL